MISDQPIITTEYPKRADISGLIIFVPLAAGFWFLGLRFPVVNQYATTLRMLLLGGALVLAILVIRRGNRQQAHEGTLELPNPIVQWSSTLMGVIWAIVLTVSGFLGIGYTILMCSTGSVVLLIGLVPLLPHVFGYEHFIPEIQVFADRLESIATYQHVIIYWHDVTDCLLFQDGRYVTVFGQNDVKILIGVTNYEHNAEFWEVFSKYIMDFMPPTQEEN